MLVRARATLVHKQKAELNNMKTGASYSQATEKESLLALTDPAFGVPFDVHFEIEDEEGFVVGLVGAHKAVMALRSPVFKAMFYGPLAEKGELIRIKKTSMFAFKEMVRYIHCLLYTSPSPRDRG